MPDSVNAIPQLFHRTIVVNHKISTGALFTAGHLCVDHRLRCCVVHGACPKQPLEAHSPWRVNQDDHIGLAGKVGFEQKRNIAQHDGDAAGSCGSEPCFSEAVDFGMDNRIQKGELRGLTKYGGPQGGTVEPAVVTNHLGAPSVDNACEGGRAGRDCLTGQKVRIDKRNPFSTNVFRDGGLATGNIAREGDREHWTLPNKGA